MRCSMRDAFAVLFFVSVGMLLDPAAALRQPRHAGGDAGGGARRQAARGVRHRRDVPLPAQGVAVGRRRPGADRRVLVHRRHAGQRARGPHGRGDQHPRRRGHHLDHPQPAPLPRHRTVRAMAGESRRDGAGRGRGRCRSPVLRHPRRRRRLWARRPHRDSPAARQRHRADHHRDERRHRPDHPRSGHGCDLRRREPSVGARRGARR